MGGDTKMLESFVCVILLAFPNNTIRDEVVIFSSSLNVYKDSMHLKGPQQILYNNNNTL